MLKTTIDDLNSHLFETIEMLKNNTDPKASPHEKIDIETARTIADLAKNVVEGYKVKAQVLSIISKSENPTTVRQLSQSFGVMDTNGTPNN